VALTRAEVASTREQEASVMAEVAQNSEVVALTKSRVALTRVKVAKIMAEVDIANKVQAVFSKVREALDVAGVALTWAEEDLSRDKITPSMTRETMIRTQIADPSPM